MADEASAFSVARRLFDYKPCEPEMWLYLAAKTFPPCRYSGTMEELRAPWPGMKVEAVPKIVQLYQSTWRRENMSLLEFARKTNKKGEIAQWVRQKRIKQGSAETLEDFANGCEMEGEKLIAVEMVSVFNDRYFGQWLALRSPFRSLEDLLHPAVTEKVPVQYQHLGNALARCPEHWIDEEAVTKELELEAMGVAKVKSFLAKLKAERHLVEQYLKGHIVQGDAEGARRSLAEAGFPAPDESLQLNQQQRLLRDNVLAAAERAAKARAVENIDELDELREAAAKEARPIAGLGPPGTGKTTVVGNCVDQILESGGRVLYALPTAQQAARVRSRHPTADVDTCAAAFWLWKDRADEHPPRGRSRCTKRGPVAIRITTDPLPAAIRSPNLKIWPFVRFWLIKRPLRPLAVQDPSALHRSETCFGKPVRPPPSAKTTEASAREAVAALAVTRKKFSGSPTGQPPAPE